MKSVPYSWSEKDIPSVSTSMRPLAAGRRPPPASPASVVAAAAAARARMRSRAMLARERAAAAAAARKPVATKGKQASSAAIAPWVRPKSSDGTCLLDFADELLIYIFSYLEPLDLIAASQVCRNFHRLLQDPFLWRYVFQTYWRASPLGRVASWKTLVVHGMKAERLWESGLHRMVTLPAYHTLSVGPIRVISITPWVRAASASPLSLCGRLPSVSTTAYASVYPATPLGASKLVVSVDGMGLVALWNSAGRCLMHERGHNAEVTDVFVLDPVITPSYRPFLSPRRAEYSSGDSPSTSFPSSMLEYYLDEDDDYDAEAAAWRKQSAQTMMGSGGADTEDLATLANGSTNSAGEHLDESKKNVPGANYGYSLEAVYFVTGSADSYAKLWSGRSCSVVGTYAGHRAGVDCVYSDGAYVYSGSVDATMRIFDILTTQCVRTMTEHTAGVRRILPIPTLQRGTVVTASLDGSLLVWDPRVRASVARLNLRGPILDAQIQQSRLAACSRNQFAVLDTRAMRTVSRHSVQRPDARFTSMHCYDFDRAAFGTVGGTVRMYDTALADAECIGVFAGPLRATVAAVRCDSRKLAALHTGLGVAVYDPEDGFLYTIPDTASACSIELDECCLVTGSRNGSVNFYSFVR